MKVFPLLQERPGAHGTWKKCRWLLCSPRRKSESFFCRPNHPPPPNLCCGRVFVDKICVPGLLSSTDICGTLHPQQGILHITTPFESLLRARDYQGCPEPNRLVGRSSHSTVVPRLFREWFTHFRLIDLTTDAPSDSQLRGLCSICPVSHAGRTKI